MKVFIEVGYDRSRALAHLVDYPGVCGQGQDAQEALENLPQALQKFSFWLKRHGQKMRTGETHSGWLRRTEPVYTIAEIMACRLREGQVVGPLFSLENQAPDTAAVEQALTWVDFTQNDFLEWIDHNGPGRLSQKLNPAEAARSPKELLTHVAEMDNFLTSRLYDDSKEASSFDFLKEHTRSYLSATYAEFTRRFKALNEAELSTIWTHDGEYWSARKVLRRAIFHRLDHLDELLRLK